MMVRKCDRCRKKIEGNFYRVEFKYGSGRIEMRHIETRDLCRECKVQFIIFMEGNNNDGQH